MDVNNSNNSNNRNSQRTNSQDRSRSNSPVRSTSPPAPTGNSTDNPTDNSTDNSRQNLNLASYPEITEELFTQLINSDTTNPPLGIHREYTNPFTAYSYADIPPAPTTLNIGDALQDCCPITFAMHASQVEDNDNNNAEDVLQEPVIIKINETHYKLYEWKDLHKALITSGMKEPTSRQEINLNRLLSPSSDEERILWKV